MNIRSKDIINFDETKFRISCPRGTEVLVPGSIQEQWFVSNLLISTLIKEADNRFTDNKIALLYLEHYIKNADYGPNKPWKLMLIDNHASYRTPEFINLANKNHILPYPLILHLTHCMQPLDQNKCNELLSSPFRQEFESYMKVVEIQTIRCESIREFLTYSKKSAFASDPQSLMPTKTERMKGGPPKRADDYRDESSSKRIKEV
ncbi:hypothetical protein MBM_07843 [Drepanopeziza brunnea f. sp. 'multigermtubi' MB_m1]|uniref:DDE-1 domain-containing protein n=1 Tax=Marssonina brunnea f. sp. multigermtubi (strain MB_m1) TaxID=1072389 RepID=K1WMV1_MARBU|nr:uncharacterized protein MBM_07843 [Drepanopeziza brunnea f. sp. 'multigermtubi' MB_m1]EKD14166.1 hypothetical protein MBM_07843 [Drepanopeziza brunnea f. sp. 'multigermtubi' MB_m1]